MISQGPEHDYHQIGPKLGPASMLTIYMRFDGFEASGDEQESLGYGLHLGRVGDPEDPCSDWPLLELVMSPEVTSIYLTHTYTMSDVFNAYRRNRRSGRHNLSLASEGLDSQIQSR